MIETRKVETESIYTRPIHSPLSSIEVVKRCPRCHSVFITDTECESCHFQFKVEPVGEPYGFKSLTYLRSDFANDFPFISYVKNNFSFRISSIFPAVVEYKRKLNRRREVLSRYLFESVRGERETRKLFFTELLDICYELIELDMRLEELLQRLEGHEKHPYFEKLYYLLISYEENRNVDRGAFSSLLNYSLFGLLRIRFILVFSGIAFGVLGFSIYVYSELMSILIG